jgi:biotin--protein ligase
MNVLVYNDHDAQSRETAKIGPGVSKRSYEDTVATLESLLKPHYVVQKVTPMELEEHPWQTSCALLVFPGGRDIPHLERLKRAAPRIAKWVQEGGAYLGFCAGAYFACNHIEWEMETPLQVKGPRPLKFFPGLSVGCVFPGFQYNSEQGARAITIADERDGSQKRYIYHNGGGEFVLSGQESGVEVLARYMGEAQGKVAAVHCTVGKGRAVLWHPHIDFPITRGPAESACKKLEQTPLEAEIKEAETDRLGLFSETLNLLGLTMPQNGTSKQAPHAPIPQLLCLSPLASPTNDAYNAILFDRSANIAAFDFPPADEAKALIDQGRSESREAGLSKKPRIIKFNAELSLSPDLTPLFNTNEYFTTLDQVYTTQTSSPLKEKWRLGEVLLYGEAVTSTQTLLNE